MEVQAEPLKSIKEGLAVRVKGYRYSQKYHQLELRTRSDWFDTDSVIVKVFHDYVSITKPTIDYKGKTNAVQYTSTDIKVVTLGADLPLGYLMFDEEDSTEDELIIYL